MDRAKAVPSQSAIRKYGIKFDADGNVLPRLVADNVLRGLRENVVNIEKSLETHKRQVAHLEQQLAIAKEEHDLLTVADFLARREEIKKKQRPTRPSTPPSVIHREVNVESEKLPGGWEDDGVGDEELAAIVRESAQQHGLARHEQSAEQHESALKHILELPQDEGVVAKKARDEPAFVEQDAAAADVLIVVEPDSTAVEAPAEEELVLTEKKTRKSDSAPEVTEDEKEKRQVREPSAIRTTRKPRAAHNGTSYGKSYSSGTTQTLRRFTKAITGTKRNLTIPTMAMKAHY
uniref:Shugoshin_C domain-containing protein n=1 Tax=Steinernema glaseri TaxID=37863 RepID=A0A1I7XZ80_9BILA